MPTAGWLRGTILASPRNCGGPTRHDDVRRVQRGRLDRGRRPGRTRRPRDRRRRPARRWSRGGADPAEPRRGVARTTRVEGPGGGRAAGSGGLARPHAPCGDARGSVDDANGACSHHGIRATAAAPFSSGRRRAGRTPPRARRQPPRPMPDRAPRRGPSALRRRPSTASGSGPNGPVLTSPPPSTARTRCAVAPSAAATATMATTQEGASTPIRTPTAAATSAVRSRRDVIPAGVVGRPPARRAPP